MYLNSLKNCLLTTFFFCLCVFSYAQSILRTGEWIQVSVTESGVYKISYEDLNSWGFSDIQSVSIYGNGAREISLINGTSLPDTLHEIAIDPHFGTDNTFNSGDYILFYAQSPDSWSFDEKKQKFVHSKHTYADKNFYYITTNKKISQIIKKINEPSSSPTQTVTSYDNLQFYEKNESRPLATGRNAFESISNSKSISFNIPNIITTENVNATISVAARHSSNTTISIFGNNESIGTLSYSAATDNKPFAILNTKTFSFLPSSSSISITTKTNFSGASSRAYLDYVELHSRCSLKITNNEQLEFRDIQSIANNTTSKFVISSKSNISIWNITNPDVPQIIPTEFSNNTTSFFANTDKLQEYIAFSTELKSVTLEGKINNQDILSDKNIDMIIVANDIFVDYANQIAQLHEQLDGFKVKVVSQSEICTEFSAGRKDISAIRNYFRYIYKTGNQQLKYVLLFGDAIYTNDIELNGPLIFTYETKESLNTDLSLCTDDFFALLDDNSGVNTNDSFVGNMSISIGRFPVNTKKEAQIVVDKIINYTTNSTYRGDWQNYLCFLADDANENQTMHMSDADLLCEMIEKNHPQFNFEKIYADAYTQTRSSAGERYPDVVTAIFERMQKGCLIFNYSGHGNETRMMAEYAIDAASITTWKNKNKLPLFVAAACNTAHFDFDGVSLGEKILLQKDGGGIAMISATRYSYSSSNYDLSDKFYSIIFEKDSLNNNRTIGEALKIAKEKTTNDIYQNKRIYTLLGDPALRLNIPTYSVIVDSINNQKSDEFTDQIKANSTISIKGHIVNENGEIDENYSGTLTIKLFDKKQSISTLGNDGNDIYTFNSYTNILFQGLASIENGFYEFSAIIPEDIYYYDGKGKLSFYAFNDSLQGSGNFNNLTINGSELTSDDDNDGPEIFMYLNDTSFTSGKITHENPMLVLNLFDNSGINISNASIGHDILLIIDDDESNQIILNDFYYSNLNSYQSGCLQYQLNNISEGQHTLKILVWDTKNNISEAELSFVVCNSESIKLKELHNFPNPMTDYTTFHFNHNQSGLETTIIIRIYDIKGNLVRYIEQENTPAGFIDESLSWDGKSSDGSPMQNGIYPYSVEIQTTNGKKIYGEQKILLVR